MVREYSNILSRDNRNSFGIQRHELSTSSNLLADEVNGVVNGVVNGAVNDEVDGEMNGVVNGVDNGQ